jgi:membrane protein YdbS with pleckstrin-like domain
MGLKGNLSKKKEQIILKEKNYEKNTVFRPLPALRNKLFLYNITVFVVVTTCIVLLGWLIATVSSFESNPGISDDGFEEFINANIGFLVPAYFILCFSIMIIAAIITVYYVRGMRFEIGDKEVIVHKGIINKMEKHIPFRTITNISSRYGVYDRLFGIGTVQIETAGKSGTQTGPEEKIEGIANYFEVRDQILEVLRKFRHQYATTTELPGKDDLVGYEKSYEEQLLNELKEIKEILKK